jgi:hypothetical protein
MHFDPISAIPTREIPDVSTIDRPALWKLD